ncbi:CinA family protein [Paludicola sp. MB14-C6]|uniref:CinA family protein n=1 Tax=Paludihabitans sp. MB14-C6 TaxID=3070656 RepID=UPI0027DCBE91|nr:CinA family protein [Paludicola sp. MB14-C6]WMJ22126.1 CinA family protein [Paludicola sp. MB14-C6]
MIIQLAQQLVEKLNDLQFTIATAESCTGGMVAQYITSVSGASSVFDCGVISYANRIKEQELNVSHQNLVEYGAVSEQVCKQMAGGILHKANADVGISVTGIAGPTGGTKEKPVGTVYIGVATKSKVFCKRLNLEGNREDIRKQTVQCLFEMTLQVLETDSVSI